MNIHSTLRAAVVPLLMISLFTEGCSCSGGHVSSGQTSIAFTFPTHGATISSTDDVNQGQDGVQVNVQVEVKGLQDGDEVILTNNQAVDGTGLPIPTTGTVSGGRVTFGGYTLPLGEVELTAHIAGQPSSTACDGVSCARITITVVETVCFFNTPRDGDVVTEDQYPDPNDPFDPFEIDVVLDCRGLEDGEYVALQVDDGVPMVTVFDASTGRVTFEQVPLSEGPNRITALSRTEPNGTHAQGASSSATVTVSTGRCAVRVRPPHGSTLLAEDDLGSGIPGMQTTVDVLTDCPDTSTVTLHMGQGVTQPTLVDVTPGTPAIAPDVGGTRFRFASFSLPESIAPFDVWLVARVEDGSGQFGVSVPNQYWVDSEVPAFEKALPGHNACLDPAYDTNSAEAGMQLTVNGSVLGVGDGSEVWVRVVDAAAPSCKEDAECEITGASVSPVCRQALCRYVGTTSNGSYTIPGVTVPNGDVLLEYIATDLAGNLSQPQLAEVFVFESLPTLTITAPADGASLTAADDLSNTEAGLQYDVALALSGVEGGSLGIIQISDQAPPNSTFAFTPVGGDSNPKLRVTLLDGARTITARITDSCGNVISDSVGVTATSSPVSIAVAAYEAGTDLSVPVANGATTVSNAVDFDVVVGTAVSDRTLNVAFFNAATNDTPPACTGAESQPGLQLTVPGPDARVVLTDQALPVSGINCIAFSSTGPGGTAEGTYVIDHRTTTMSPAFTVPASPVVWTDADDSDANPTNGFNHDLEVTLTPAADVSGTLAIQISGSTPLQLVERAISAGEDVITFGNVFLPVGAYQLEAVWTDRYGLSATSPAAGVEVQGAGPAILVTTPQPGAVVNNADLDVVIEHTGGPEPAVCRLFVDNFAPGSEVASDIWTPGAPSLTFSNTALADLTEGEHELRVECADSTPHVTVYMLGVITIDDTAPASPVFVDEPAGTPGQVIYADGAFVNGLTPMSGGGTRHAVAVRVDATLESLNGFRLELTSTAPGDAPQTQALCLWEGAAGPTQPGCPSVIIVGEQVQDVTFPSVNFGSAPEGTLTLELSLLDAAGNRSAPVVVNLVKDTVPPVITQVVPDPSSVLLTASNDAEPATPDIVDIFFRYNVSGAVTNADCVTDPDKCVTIQIDPPPSNLPTGVARQPVASGQAIFPLLSFPDLAVGSYTAQASIHDPAGNKGIFLYTFQVQAVEPKLEWSNPAPAPHPVSINASFPGAFTVFATGFQTGTPVVMCSTLLPAGITPLPAASCDPQAVPPQWNQLGCPCRTGGAEAGHVVAARTLTGGADFPIAGLSDGTQVMHFEAREVDGAPDLASSLLTIELDRTPPAIVDLSLDENLTSNDDTTIRLGGAEGTAAGQQLTTQMTVTVTGSAEGETVVVRSGANIVGTGTLDAAGSATFLITLTQGLAQVLSAQASDPAGNQSIGGPTVTVDVDVTPPSVSVPPAPKIYTSLDGDHTQGTPEDRTDDSLPVQIGISVGDNNLQGGTLTVQVYNAATGGSPVGAPVVLGLTSGQTTRNATVNLVAGVNWVEASVTDPFGNSTTAARQLYEADFYGPLLSLSLRDGSGALQACGDSEDTACIMDTLAPVAGRTQPDITGTNPYCPPPPFDGECNTAGSDLRVSLTECANSPSEDCAASPVLVRLQSALVGGAYSQVFNSTFSVAGDLNPDVSIGSQPGAGGYAFAAGIVRQVRLHARDANGNESFSNVMYIKLNQGGIAPDVQLLDASLQPFSPSVNLADTDAAGEIYLGQAQNVSATPGTFAMNLRIDLPVFTAEVPTSVEISCAPNSCRPGQPTVTETNILGSAPTYFVEVVGIELPTSQPLTPIPAALDIAVYCGGNLCGQRDYSQVHADIDPPTYQFDRCSLCALDVPYAGASADCSTCTADNASASAVITGEALWNADGDQDPSSATSFSITATQPLVLRVRGLDDNQSVSLVSNQGGIGGSTVSSVSGCGSTVTACSVSFDALEVPSLAANASRHRLTVSFTDKAGNAAVPEADRCVNTCDPEDEAITALVDTIRPEETPTLACVGESTLPFSGAPAHALEDPQCATYCGMTGQCDRRGGAVTLRFTAPHDDGSGPNPSATPVVSYEVLVAALSSTEPEGLAIPYGPSSTVHTSCSTVVAGADVERVIVLPNAPQAPGTEEVVGIDGLFPHRDYCFAVLGVDDAGNRTAVVSAHANRVLPLVHDVPPLGAPPAVTPFIAAAPVDNQPEGAFFTSAPGEGSAAYVQTIGDMDNDGIEDFVVAGSTAGVLDVFLSNGPNLTPARSLTTPIRLDVGPANSTFGWSAAGGDFTGDGISDLAVCDWGAYSSEGAVHLFYGRNGVGLDTTRTNDAQDPNLPNIIPDATLRAPSGGGPHYICNKLLLEDIDGVVNAAGRTSADLIILPFAANGFGPVKRVLGYKGGGTNRFPSALVTMNFNDGVPSGWDPAVGAAPGQPGRPDFTLRARTSPGDWGFPTTVTALNLDTEPGMELVVSDSLSNHGGGLFPGAGEIYVYKGGPGLSGDIAAPNSTPAPGALLNILRYRATGSTSTDNLGSALGRIPDPEGTGVDWLYAKTGTRRGLIFKATAADGIVPRDPDVVNPREYPPGGLDGSGNALAYWELNNQLWDGSGGASRFGGEMVALGEWDALPGVDIAVAPAHLNDRYVFIYSFSQAEHDAGNLGFVRRVILRGESPSFGDSVAVIRNYFGLGDQLSVTTYSFAAPDGMVHLYR